MKTITVEQIEEAVKHLPADEYRRFYNWLIALDNKRWDRQIEEDVAAGRLDDLADEAEREFREGRCRKM